MIIQIEGACQYEGCIRPATHIAAGRIFNAVRKQSEHRPPACYCEEHANMVVSEEYAEYEVECPNCGCYFGV